MDITFLDKNTLPALSIAEMRECDRLAMEEYGIPGVVLMENAGRAVAQSALSIKAQQITIFCGGGNNGGDGLVAARYLINYVKDVRIVFSKNPNELKGDSHTHWRPLKKMEVPFIIFQNAQKLLQFIKGSELIIDALLGTGARTPLKEPFHSLLTLLGESDIPQLAVDVPSGLNADSGEVEESAVRAQKTITMGAPKKGLLLKKALPYVGELLVGDIGFPKKLMERFVGKVFS